ncbi:hypothetical protein SPAN111604_09155 [Sphingomonas antarctica]|uniref:hypothetical protein n=1 Tax=Sphingomonas antarctica TaxID=2040274 RepID=UPI0039E7E4BF
MAKQSVGRIEFTPVLRKKTRHDGWTAENQMIGSRRSPDGAGQRGALTTRSFFIDALAAGASITRETRAAGRSLSSVYKLKDARDSARFVAA